MEKALAKNISISLTEDLIKSVSEYCSQRGCSRSWFFKKAVEQFQKALTLNLRPSFAKIAEQFINEQK